MLSRGKVIITNKQQTSNAQASCSANKCNFHTLY